MAVPAASEVDVAQPGSIFDAASAPAAAPVLLDRGPASFGGTGRSVVLLDRSGSMDGAAMLLAKNDIKAQIADLDADDRVTLFVFGGGQQGEPEPLLPTLSRDARNLIGRLEDALDAVPASGQSDGLEEVLDLALRRGAQAVFLYTDGKLSDEPLSDSPSTPLNRALAHMERHNIPLHLLLPRRATPDALDRAAARDVGQDRRPRPAAQEGDR